jgi:hypothetical protein
LLAGSAPWQLEAAAGLIDTDERRGGGHPRTRGDRARADRRAHPHPTLSLVLEQSDESVVLFCGRVDSAAAGGCTAPEGTDIRVVVKTLAEIEALIEAGAIESGHTLIGLHWLLRHRDRLRLLWLKR